MKERSEESGGGCVGGVELYVGGGVLWVGDRERESERNELSCVRREAVMSDLSSWGMECHRRHGFPH